MLDAPAGSMKIGSSALSFWQRVRSYGFPYPWIETAASDLCLVELFDAEFAALKAEELNAADRRTESYRRGRS